MIDEGLEWSRPYQPPLSLTVNTVFTPRLDIRPTTPRSQTEYLLP
ncbi:hypothetical protein HMPREF1487_08914 [Pseudomonas sp. HPB0071]|uniref:Uncharacterized protein n=1 Tax=Pseudomonas luteola TaxID=47886 RepID=A0A2X2DFQ7_PSELU|nr:hypothetical protein HMPREF1487_08914 [Pseudomonas sp. HPB0071]SHJ03043.1 hypothetical protein SAMN05216295_106180 [Pseudomonas zeshuii]SPZ16326.1 Uncharacterised protein [Pseudomonas luteola]